MGRENPRQVDVYEQEDGSVPLEAWLSALKDRDADIGDGILELRIDSGGGFRIYCVDDGKSVLIL